MAPSRRRGSSKAASAVAAAAAAKRNWKVGDLVLAKVKGFPAWPATVSEPEKWGYSTDWKKVLVYFFGTKQIAFCNPADVEVFTEEKKKSLLSKRHGKGADFVRAVQEIVDCFDKSKKTELIDELTSDNEVTVPIAANLEDPMGRTGNETDLNSPVVVANSRLESSCLSSGDKESLHDIDVRAEVENNSFSDRDIGEQLENASFLAPIRATLTESNCSRKRLIDTPLQSFVRQKRATTRRSRNTVNVEQYKLQRVMQVNDNNTNTGYALPNGNRNESAKRSRRIRKSPGTSIWHQMESPCYSAALISNVSSEENCSEICATNSDTISLNGGDTLESCCKNEHPGITVEVMDQGIKLSDKFSLPVETFVFKKKRKPNRKRLSHSIAALINSPKGGPGLDIKAEKSMSLSPSSCENVPDQLINSPKKSPGLNIKVEKSTSLSPSSCENVPDQLINSPKKSPGLDVKVEKSTSLSPSSCENVPDQLINSPDKSPGLDIKREKSPSLSPSSCENLPDQLSKANGDEHLPLVKRARARMGKSLSEEKQLNEVVNAENVSSKEVPINNSEASLSCPDGLHDLNGFSAANGYHHTEKEPIWNASKYQLRGSVDCEAALPPSKRLHRALEAMSANAVEEGQTFVDAPGATKLTPSNDCSDSPDRSSSHISVDEVGSGSEFRKASSLGDNGANVNAREPELHPCSASPTSKVLETTVSTPKGCDHPMDYSNTPKSDGLVEMEVVAKNSPEVKYVDDLPLNVHSDETNAGITSPHPSSRLEPANVSASQLKCDKHEVMGSSHESFSGTMKLEASCFLEDQLARGQGTLHPNKQPSNCVRDSSEVNGASISSPGDDGEHLSVVTVDSCKKLQSLMSPLETNVSSMCEVVKDHARAGEDVDMNSMKVLIAAAQAKRQLSLSTSVSDNVPEARAVCDFLISPSSVRRMGCYEQVSPPSSVICHLASADDRNHLLPNGSLDVHCKKSTRSFETKDVGNSASPFSDRQNSSGKRLNAEANAVRKSFESMLGTLSRTKESIGRATRIAIDGAKCGIAGEVLEILLRNLEAESSMHRRVDLFFLVDSITQCSRGQKGDIGEIYPSAVQAMLPRLLSAAAPPGNAARENRRQCLKVLRLWLERKTLPETIIRHHMRELESSDVSFTATHSRRPLRMERAMNDPIREMEGMHVDEYGSNASFQLPGFCMPRMVEDEEGSDAEGSFEAVTPEQDTVVPVEQEAMPTSAVERHCHILEDVDGELEMEDVAPLYEIEKCSTGIVTAVDKNDTLHHQFQQHLPLQFPPPLPVDCPPSPPPLPASPPPVAPPPPPLLPQSVSHSFPSCPDLKFRNPHNMQNPSQQHMSQQLDAPSLNSVMSNALHCYAPGYRELGKQSVRAGSFSSSSSSCKTCAPTPSVPTGSTQQRDRGTLHNKSYHLQPPPPTLSNQFSYVHADQRRQSWVEASSSFTRSFQFGQDIHTEDIYENRERIDSIPHERLVAPVRSVHVQSDNTEAAYAPNSQYGPPRESARILDRGWSFPPRILNYHNPPPFRPSEAPNFWRPR